MKIKIGKWAIIDGELFRVYDAKNYDRSPIGWFCINANGCMVVSNWSRPRMDWLRAKLNTHLWTIGCLTLIAIGIFLCAIPVLFA